MQPYPYPQYPQYSRPPAPMAHPMHAAPPYLAYAAGNHVALSMGAFPPNVCAKCGCQDSVVRRSESFVYTPGWVYLTYLAGLLVGIIVSSVTTKRGLVHVPLCQDCNDRWNKAILWWRLSFLPFFISIIASIAMVFVYHGGRAWDVLGILFLASLASLIVFPFAVAIITRGWKMRAANIDDRFVTLANVHPVAAGAFVASALPPQPYGYAPHGYLPPPPAGYPYAR